MQSQLSFEPHDTANGHRRSGQPAFDVVAVAASAGGLEAITAVLRAFPADFPAAVLVLQHMSNRTGLVEVLQRQTDLMVDWATHGAPSSLGRSSSARPNALWRCIPMGCVRSCRMYAVPRRSPSTPPSSRWRIAM